MISFWSPAQIALLVILMTLLPQQGWPEENQPLESTALKYFQQKNFEKVIATLEKPMNSLSANSLKMLSRSHQELQKYDQAVLVLEYLKQKEPKDHLVALNLARVYLKLGRWEDSLQEYKRTTEIRPQFYTAYEEQLRYFEEKKRFYDMRLLLTDMLREFGERKEIVRALCQAHYEEGFVEQSKAFCQKGIVLDEKQPGNYVYLGLTHKNIGEKELAGKLLQQAGQRFPASEIAQWAAGDLERENGNYLGAEVYLLRAKENSPESIRVLKSLAETQFQLGKFEEALAQYNQWCQLEKRVPDEFKKSAGLLLIEQPKWHKKYLSRIATCNAQLDNSESES